MDVTIRPAALGGTVPAIPSKSDAHRKLICASLSDRRTSIRIDGRSKDIDATISCLNALGADIRDDGVTLEVGRIKRTGASSPLLDCCESGSTLRFMLPVAATLGSARFIGCGRLPERPLDELIDVMEKNGVVFLSRKLPIDISGRLRGGEYSLPGNISSQYITGLLMALPALEEDSIIRLTTRLESASYINITLAALGSFGVKVEVLGDGYRVPGRQRFDTGSSSVVEIDGDWSNAAFYLAAGALNGSVTVSGLDINSPQGDRKILDILKGFGAEVICEGKNITVRSAPLHGQTIDVSDVPDLLPILSVVAANADGQTEFINAQRLRIKESDRLSATAAMLSALGGKAAEREDSLTVYGTGLTGGNTDGCNDHRMVMSAAIAASVCKEDVRISGAHAIAKSYPSFFEHYRTLGGNATERA